LEKEKPIIEPGLEVESDGPHIAHYLGFGFLKSKIEASLAARAGAMSKIGRNARFSRTRSTGYQNTASPIVAIPAKHGVEARNPR
jgi:hypothetical protein